MQTPEGFRSLRSLLCEAEPVAYAPQIPESEVVPSQTDACAHEVLAEVARFRATLADLVDASKDELLAEIARRVLGRELALRPVDVAAIADQIFDEMLGEQPLRIRVHPADARSFAASTVPVEPDDSLQRGDLWLDVRSGSFDASLNVRLAGTLAVAR